MKLLTPAALTRTLLEWPRCALCKETPLVPSDALIDAKLPLRSLVADQVWRWLKNSCPTRLSCLWCARNTAADWAVPGCGHHRSGHHQMFQHTLGSDPGLSRETGFRQPKSSHQPLMWCDRTAKPSLSIVSSSRSPGRRPRAGSTVPLSQAFPWERG